MQVGLRHFRSCTLDWLAGSLRAGGATRHALARGLCERTVPDPTVFPAVPAGDIPGAELACALETTAGSGRR